MDFTTKLIELAFSKPVEERERFLREMPNVVILPDFEEKLFLYLYTHANRLARDSVARILAPQ